MLDSFYWALPSTFFIYCAIDAFLTKRLAREQIRFPLVGSTVALPRFILSLLFAGRAIDLLQTGYKKFKNSAFQLIRNDGRIVILPVSLLEELAAIPGTVASPQAALERDFFGRYTGLDQIVENRLHHSIVQRRLTPRLPLLVPRMEKAVAESFSKAFSEAKGNGQWTEFQPYQVLGRISARVAADAIVGPAFCNDPTWLDISFNYTEIIFKTVIVLRMFPTWMHPLISLLLPSYWEGKKCVKRSKELLGPRIQELIEKNDARVWEPRDDSADDLNVLSWLSSMAKGRERSPDVISHVLVHVALASVHTTLLRMVNVLYDVTAAGSTLQDELVNEINAVRAEGGWDKKNDSTLPYDQLHRLDSVMRESQRVSPSTVVGLKRLFQEPYTFKDGTHVTKGTYVCLPIYAIENDAENAPRPEEFDGLRSFRAREELLRQVDTGDMDSKLAASKLLFTSPSSTNLSFGYGKFACPGRVFASCVIKMVMVKVLTDYEYSFLPGSGRPTPLMVHEFLFSKTGQKMLIRRKEKASSPF